jgi:hypothetical protein
LEVKNQPKQDQFLVDKLPLPQALEVKQLQLAFFGSNLKLMKDHYLAVNNKQKSIVSLVVNNFNDLNRHHCLV